jgi:4-hydroxy-2-oxoheptanedioate aldolase
VDVTDTQVCGQTESAEQARLAVQAARFAPLGKRSFPPFALLPGHNDGTPQGKTPFDVWNENAAIIMQIESACGVQHADDIAAVDGGKHEY